jgi:adenine-specific DNA methylase
MQKAFIETQFPIARLSAETLRERNAGAGQTLTGLGKWWGRKQLIHVRAIIIGALMPASSNPEKDREIFLRILTMDDDGTWERQKGEIPVNAWREAAPPEIQEKYFGARGFLRGIPDEEKGFVRAEIWEGLTDSERRLLDSKRKRPISSRVDFDALPYAERIGLCERPENVEGPSQRAWTEINQHLSTSASNLPELVLELGQRAFGHTPKVGDAFCGGGSIPFEAARIGCDAYGSDLNPVAGLLTWASLNLIGGGKKVQEEARLAHEATFAAADRQITEWGIEKNDSGERADAYLYCIEVKPEGCDYLFRWRPVGSSQRSTALSLSGIEVMDKATFIQSSSQLTLLNLGSTKMARAQQL